MTRLLLGLGLAVVGFGAGFAVAFESHSETHTVRTTTTRFEVINGSKSAGREPSPIPTLVEGAIDPRRVALSSAVPADANLDSADYVTRPPKQLVVTWDREHLTRNGQAAIWERRGIAIWQLDRGNTATWRRVYTYETLVNNVVGVEGFGVFLGDMSGDARPEVLVFFDKDGSAGGGIYHLFASTGYRLRQPLVRRLSEDEGTMSFGRDALVIREGVDFRGPGIHCCFRKVRIAWLRWQGDRLVTVRKVLRKNRRGWPPGEEKAD
jgi:hypothetical protein